MTTAPAEPTTTLPSTEQDWADISDDDDDEETPPTVKVDSIDLNKLSINEKGNEKAPGVSHVGKQLMGRCNKQ